MRGVIDLLYESNGTLVVADYKTNRVDADSLPRIVEHYRLQGNAYKEAVRRVWPDSAARPVEFELVFLRTGESIRV